MQTLNPSHKRGGNISRPRLELAGMGLMSERLWFGCSLEDGHE